MIANKRNAPHKRRKKIKTQQKNYTRKPILIDKEKNEFTKFGSVVCFIMLAIIVSQGAVVFAPLYFLGIVGMR